MTICKIILPVVTKSNNELLKMHYRDRKRLKNCYGWEFKLVGAHDLKYRAEMRERRRVTIISYRARICDDDNFVGGLKPLLDSMVDLDLLCDDSPRFLELVPIQEQVNKDFRTEITIEKLLGYEGKFKRKEVQ